MVYVSWSYGVWEGWKAIRLATGREARGSPDSLRSDTEKELLLIVILFLF